jgi:hypothetical protein
MREDYKITKSAYLYTYKRFNKLCRCARKEISIRFCHLPYTLHYNFNRYFKKHLGFEFRGYYNQRPLIDYLVIVTDEKKFTLLKLKYGI